MKNWRQKLERFMIGRNGADQLSQGAVMFGIVLYVFYFISGKDVFNWLSTAALFYALFRVFSKNTSARYKENAVYMRYIQYVKTKWEFRKTHKVFLCRKCGKIVRVPRGKGRIEVTCPVCRTKTVIRS